MSELLPCKLCGIVPMHRADGLIAHGTWNSECPLWESAWMTTEQWTKLMGQGEPVAWMWERATEVNESNGRYGGWETVSSPKMPMIPDNDRSRRNLVPLFAAPPQAQGDDTARLSWLIRKLSGKALRDAGVIYSAGSETIRAAIDAAMK